MRAHHHAPPSRPGRPTEGGFLAGFQDRHKLGMGEKKEIRGVGDTGTSQYPCIIPTTANLPTNREGVLMGSRASECGVKTCGAATVTGTISRL